MTDLNSTEKVLKILGAFLPENNPRGNLELSRMLGIHRASVNRILSILKQYGFMQQERKTKLYKLGPAIAAFGHAIQRSSMVHLRNIAEPHLLKLSREIRESVGLAVLTDEGVLHPCQMRGPQAVSVAFEFGERGAINSNSGAKAIMAFWPGGRLQNLIDKHPRLPGFTSKTLTQWGQVIAQFKEIRETGVAYDIEEYNLDVLAVGTPVFDVEHNPVCAVNILVPSLRSSVISDPDVLRTLKQTASAISLELES